MYTSGSDVFTSLVETNGVTSDDYGLTAIPTEGADAGVLVGGTLAAVNVKADDATKAAAIKWIDFFYLSKLLDQEQAVADAQVRFDNGQPVGTPVLPIDAGDLRRAGRDDPGRAVGSERRHRRPRPAGQHNGPGTAGR